ncbi:MAG TPA: hypothetical protein DCS93_39360 [Microscillaceae bacterium]|nr:hypothetical protein [Microscillaceae bacterium]
MKFFQYLFFSVCLLCLWSCDEQVRNIAGPTTDNSSEPAIGPTPVNPWNINTDGFDLLEKMQGHWVGTNRVIATDYDWFSFDYRPISASHVHGIFEGGTSGNLLTSFFVTDFKNTRTIMARNGGVLNGIYRTSYFVLDSVGSSPTRGKFYRLVDAIGGRGVMSMELRFKGDSLYFNAYTSRLGLSVPPARHMTFKATKQNLDLAQTAATAVGFPQNVPAWDFSNGFVSENLYVNQGKTEAESASFLFEDANSDVFTMAPLSGDPFTISNHPRLANLQVNISRSVQTQGKSLFVYLSKLPLTDTNGLFQFQTNDAFNSVLKFPVIVENQNDFLFTYLHPGEYYLTVIADANNDQTISQGDITSISKRITVLPETTQQVTVNDLIYQN